MKNKFLSLYLSSLFIYIGIIAMHTTNLLIIIGGIVFILDYIWKVFALLVLKLRMLTVWDWKWLLLIAYVVYSIYTHNVWDIVSCIMLLVIYISQVVMIIKERW